MNFPSCCFCQEPVLELKGQCSRLPAYLLQSVDEELRERGVFGTAHLSCLEGSPHRFIWLQRLFAHACNSAHQLIIRETAEIKVIRNEVLKETLLYWTKGPTLAVRDREIQLATVTEHTQVLIPFDEEYNMELGGRPELAAKIRTQLKEQGFYPVAELARELGFDGKMKPSRQFEEARFCHCPELESYWEGDWVSCRVSYQVGVSYLDYCFAWKKSL